MIVEVAEELFGIVIDIIWLLEEARAEKVIQDLSQFGMILEVADMFLLDIVLNLSKVGLELRVKILVALHCIT